MKYILLVLMILAVGAAGKLIGGFGPSEDERRAKWQGKRTLELDEDPDIQSNMHGEAE